MSTGKANACKARPRTERLGLLAGLLLAAGPALAASVHYRCEAVYLPARSTWVRHVEIEHDDHQVHALRIDGVAVYSFAVDGTVIRTSLDNERIVLDTASLHWQSDFRGQAQGQGRCERG
jgi:hypothetical protein